MIPKVVKSESEYELALERIQQIMGAKAGTPEADELEVLVTLVEPYEERNFYVGLPSPIEAIKFRMEQAGLRQRDLVPFIGSQSKVSEVLNGKRPLSLKMMRALRAGLGIPAEVLLQEPGATIPDKNPDLDWGKFPIKEILRRGWFRGFGGSLGDAREQAEELLRRFLQPIESEGFRLAFCRQHVRSGSRMDEYALLAWFAQVLSLARSQPVIEFKPGTVTSDFMQRLVHLSYLDEGPRLAREFLSKNGIRLVVLKHMPRTHLDGAATSLRSGEPVVALTLRYDRLDNFWFSLCHELAHVALHLKDHKRDCFLDDLDHEGDRLEGVADNFATDALIPPKAWSSARIRETRKASDIRRFAASLGIHPAIVAGRIRREQRNYRILSQLVGRGEVRRRFPEEFGIETAAR